MVLKLLLSQVANSKATWLIAGLQANTDRYFLTIKALIASGKEKSPVAQS